MIILCHNFSTFLGRAGICLGDLSLGAIAMDDWTINRLTGETHAAMAK